MSENHWDNQLSAWFDGELSAGERAEAEQRLETSADARQELAEIEQLSGLLAELPHESLPVGFSQQVTERAIAATRDTESPSVPYSGNGRQSWSRSAGALIATAAALLMMLALFGPPRPTDPVAMNEGETPSRSITEDSSVAATPGAVVANKFATDKETADDAEMESFAMRQPKLLKSFDDSAGRKRHDLAYRGKGPAPFGDSLRESSVVASKPEAAAAVKDGELGKNSLVRSDDSSGLVFDTDLSRAEVGQVVEAFDRSAGLVSIVRLTVIDRQQGLKNLQVLLKRGQIQTGSPIGTEPLDILRPERLAAEEKLAADSGQSRLIAVYVEATGPQLSAVLAQMNREVQFQKLEVERPVAVAQLEFAWRMNQQKLTANASATRFTGRSRAFAGLQKSKEAEKQNSPADRSGERVSLAKKEAQPAAPKKNGRADRRESLVKNDKVKELARISRQLQLSLTEEALERATRSTSAPAATGQFVKSRKLSDQQDAFSRLRRQSANFGGSGSHAFQVLFILDEAGGKAEPKKGAAGKLKAGKPNGAA